MAPISEWLKATRTRQVNPETGRPWSQDYFVSRMNEWAEANGVLNEDGNPYRLHRPNYIGYEGSKNPGPETVARFVAFWASMGEPGPDSMPADPEPVAAPDLASALLALTAELQEWRRERQSLRDQIEELQAMVADHDLRLARAPSEAGTAGTAARASRTGSAH